MSRALDDVAGRRRPAEGDPGVLGLLHGSLRRKIVLTVLGASLAAIALGFCVLIHNELTEHRRILVTDTTMLASAIGRNLMASLAFQDRRSAEETLAGLRQNEAILVAAAVGRDGEVFAIYQRDDVEDGRALLDIELPGGHRFGPDRLELVRPLELENDRLGTLHLVSDLRVLDTWVDDVVRVAAFAVLSAVALAIGLAVLLQNWIAAPIVRLAGLAQEVSRSEDFSLRAVATGDDEVGHLARAFNDMLAKLEHRDAALRRAMSDAEHSAAQKALILDGTRKINEQLEIEIRAHERAERDLRTKTRELERSNLELDQFAYVASHDLQEPLRMVSMFTELLRKRHGDRLPEEALGYIRFATDGAARMRQLIRDLLEYSRVGRSEGAPERVALEHQLEDVLGTLRVAIQESGARITHDPLPVVEGHALRLSQLLQNLIQNAIKFCGEASPEIHVGCEPGEGEWHLWVSDNGIGIQPEFRDRVFLVFQRLHTRREYAGTGIGLSLCQRIVEAHGGRIWVDGAPGGGTRFHFTLAGVRAGAQIGEEPSVKRLVDGSSSIAHPGPPMT